MAVGVERIRSSASATSASMASVIKKRIFSHNQFFSRSWASTLQIIQYLMFSRAPLIRDPARYKTTPCRNGWEDPKRCPYGKRCQHAHHKGELRIRFTRTNHSPPPPPPSTTQSPVTVITETPAPSNFKLLCQPVHMPPLPPGPPPPLPRESNTSDDNETLEYLDSILSAMRDT